MRKAACGDWIEYAVRKYFVLPHLLRFVLDAGEDAGWRGAVLQRSVLGLGAGIYCGDTTYAGNLKVFWRVEDADLEFSNA